MTFNSFPIPTKPGFEALLLQKSGEVAGHAASADADADRADQAAADAEAARDKSQAWAESATAPGDPGTKSAKTHAGEAAASALAAFNSEGSAQGSLESLYARYLGAHSTAPVVDGNGDPLEAGALYWDTTADAMLAWTGSAWKVSYAPSDGSVTSVGVSMPAGFTVSGSPIVSSGIIGVSYSSGYQGYTSAEASKLSGIESGAQVNVQSDWNAGSGDAYIMNKPVLGDLAGKDTASITSDTTGTLPVNRGGTGATTAANARTALGLGTAAVQDTGYFATAAQGAKADNALAQASNLSDLANAATARSNLGLGELATGTKSSHRVSDPTNTNTTPWLWAGADIKAAVEAHGEQGPPGEKGEQGEPGASVGVIVVDDASEIPDPPAPLTIYMVRA